MLKCTVLSDTARERLCIAPLPTFYFKRPKLLDELKIILNIGPTPLPQLSPFMANLLLDLAQLGQNILKVRLQPHHIIIYILHHNPDI